MNVRTNLMSQAGRLAAGATGVAMLLASFAAVAEAEGIDRHPHHLHRRWRDILHSAPTLVLLTLALAIATRRGRKRSLAKRRWIAHPCVSVTCLPRRPG
jgi:hypothetical protein